MRTTWTAAVRLSGSSQAPGRSLSATITWLQAVVKRPRPPVENHVAAVSLHFMHYNFARVHKSLKSPYPRTPAMAAGVADHIWTLEEIAGLLD